MLLCLEATQTRMVNSIVSVEDAHAKFSKEQLRVHELSPKILSISSHCCKKPAFAYMLLVGHTLPCWPPRNLSEFRALAEVRLNSAACAINSCKMLKGEPFAYVHMSKCIMSAKLKGVPYHYSWYGAQRSFP